ncbi:thylakoid lumenal 15.0 kDa protein 2, chloroplastic [Selaginella moellendorffii]|nr:thylakoid lumenal 15.0 kDa protein 2, chloroplastic [Selaginella moellendorffii]|eukprot:XP_002968784.2 thylakoid lumenal 15.0 kDa protein 2, chloroplastic [Selaginella moellendorffii]
MALRGAHSLALALDRPNAGRRCVAARWNWGEAMERAKRSVLLPAALSLSVALSSGPTLLQARPEGVNKPELLPRSYTPVIDVAGFLSEGQEGRIAQEIKEIEELTGFKLRVLAQNYPNTPGLAIREFWKVDDNTIVFVADPSLGNILNFNVGASVDLNVPRSFWSRLAGQYGNVFYWREKGEDASIEAAVAAISSCLREPPGPRACSTIN